jgi:DNA-binding Lrp family transcriptional regulator
MPPRHGEWCFLVKARAATPLALQDLIDRIRAVAGVTNTTTTLALSSLRQEDPPTATASSRRRPRDRADPDP